METTKEKKIPLGLAVAGLGLVIVILTAMVIFAFYLVKQRETAERVWSTANSIYQEMPVPAGAQLLEVNQYVNPLARIRGCTGAYVVAIYGTNRPQEEIAAAYVHYFIEEKEYKTQRWNERPLEYPHFFKGYREAYISFDFVEPLLPEETRARVAADDTITLVYSVMLSYTEPPNNDPSLDCDL